MPNNSALRNLLVGAAGITAGGLAVLGWAAGIERRRFVLRHETLEVLPAGSTPIDVLHLSDFHLAPGQRKKQRFVQALADLQPDLIVATGDNLGHKHAIPHLAEMLEPFRGIPTLSVFGSNDYYGPILKSPFTYLMPKRTQPKRVRDLDEDALRALLFDDLGWTDLSNRAAIVEAGGLRIRALGVDDPHIKVDRLPRALESLNSVSQNAEWDLTLGLVHAPYQRILTPFVEAAGAEAVFAGHTHGGQVCLPGGRAIVANCDVPLDQAGGLSTWDAGGKSAYLHVSRGLGTSIYSPVRLFCPPEATLLRLVPRSVPA